MCGETNAKSDEQKRPPTNRACLELALSHVTEGNPARAEHQAGWAEDGQSADSSDAQSLAPARKQLITQGD
jgi:hypothetical protein